MWLDPADSSSYPGSGTTWTDLSTFGANITLVNNPTYSAGQPAHFFFAAINQQYGISSTANVLGATQYTKSVWFNWDEYGDNNMLSSAVGGHFMYGAGTSTLYCGHSDWNNFQAFPSNTTFNTGSWYFVTLTFDTTNGMNLYVNGVHDNTQNYILTPLSGDGSTNIGMFDTGNFLQGSIGQVFCYNRVLTADEQLQNFNSTKTRYGL